MWQRRPSHVKREKYCVSFPNLDNSIISVIGPFATLACSALRLAAASRHSSLALSPCTRTAACRVGCVSTRYSNCASGFRRANLPNGTYQTKGEIQQSARPALWRSTANPRGIQCTDRDGSVKIERLKKWKRSRRGSSVRGRATFLQVARRLQYKSLLRNASLARHLRHKGWVECNFWGID